MKLRLRWQWWLILLVPVLVGLNRLRLEVDIFNLLPESLPAVQGLRIQQRYFASSRELIITVRGSDEQDVRNAAQQLGSDLRRKTDLVAGAQWQAPWMESPAQLGELIAVSWLNQKPEEVTKLAERLAPDQLASTLESARNALTTSLSPDDLGRLGYDPLGLSRLPGFAGSGTGLMGQGDEMFVSPDSLFRLIHVRSAHKLVTYRDCAAWLSEIRGIVENTRLTSGLSPPVSIGYTGGPVFLAEIAAGVERDMRNSVLGTLAIIAALFLWAHRRVVPLLWLLTLLGLTLVGTLALGGLFLGTLNVVSFGFAAILLGLAVDYGLVLYQEFITSDSTVAISALRQRMAPGILWSAVTTACAFAILNFSGLPGLGQLGTLVTLGIGLGAVLMLFVYLPLASRRVTRNPAEPASEPVTPSRSRDIAVLALSGILALGAALIVLENGTPVDHSVRALQPEHSQAYKALDEIEAAMGIGEDPLWLLFNGTTERAVAEHLQQAESWLSQEVTNGNVASYALPTALWPHPDRQSSNLITAAKLANQVAGLRQATLAAGFSEDAFKLAANVLTVWEKAASSRELVWPTSEGNRWLLDKVATRTPEGWLALGMVRPTANVRIDAWIPRWASDERFGKLWVAGWPLLGEGLLRHVVNQLPWLIGVMIVMVASCLWLAFRRTVEVVLSFVSLGLALLGLLAVMSLFHWSWNLLNLMALPLLLGSGVDYTIHVQLALRAHPNDIDRFRRATGRALFLCAGTTIAGFGSLGWSKNAGLASLGLVCAAGVTCVYLVSVYLLPAWWRCVAGPVGARSCGRVENQVSGLTTSPSYRIEVWRLGLLAVRLVPMCICRGFSRLVAFLYRTLRPQRVALVAENLLPVLNGDRTAAHQAARSLITNFSLKMTDLFRVEAGCDRDISVSRWSGYEHFVEASSGGRGVLLVTVHVGNWEYGGYLLGQRGVRLLVLTQAEPGQEFTELRQKARARGGIETLVVGQDALAFVTIIKRLEEGAAVALLMDRPSLATAVTVDFFGRPFQASVAAAELARASGAAVVPVYVIREEGSYSAHIMPQVAYDRRSIGDREARRRFTGEIVRRFEPVVRQYADQWYHFVPIWPRAAGSIIVAPVDRFY